MRLPYMDSDLLYRGAQCKQWFYYIEVPFIDSDLLYRSALYRLICYIEVPFIDSDLLYIGAFLSMAGLTLILFLT